MPVACIGWNTSTSTDLRVDAVASMLYRDYSRKQGEWVPNIYGGRENLEAIGFLRHFNAVVEERCPGAMTIAEESTAWPGVSSARSVTAASDFRSNGTWGGCMTHCITWNAIRCIDATTTTNSPFGLIYAYTENFVLPLSHDEVVYGKGSLIEKMPGDEWQRFANLRAYFGFMWAHPWKKAAVHGR